MYVAFLDEFGHIGPFINRSDGRYNQSPVFGLAGYLISHHNARRFATWFYKLKNDSLRAELRLSKKHPATWEKKGNELLTTRNMKKYRNVAEAINRIINQIYKLDGRIFYYGREKYKAANDSNSSGLYATVLGHAIRQIDSFCETKNKQFFMILDQHSDRIKLLESACQNNVRI